MMPQSRPQTDWSDTLKRRTILILGAGRSGLAAARLLKRHGARLLLADDLPAFEPRRADELAELGVRSFTSGAFDFDANPVDEIVASPGVPPSHHLIREALRRNIPVISEIECGFRLTRLPVVAITGTNGKTTTTALVTHILQFSGVNAVACGNIGHALCDVLAAPEKLREDSLLIVEVSSYQLELIEQFHPKIAVILNLTPDHLARHQTLEQYLQVKARIALNQTRDDVLALNADDLKVWRLAKDAAPQVWGFSRRFRQIPGVFVSNNMIMICRGGEAAEEVCSIRDLPIPGQHNQMNALAAVCVCVNLGLDAKELAAGLTTFEGVEHRIELVREFGGVQFVNDSKATNLDATEVALKCFNRPIVLICGGRDKGDDFLSARSLLVEKVKTLIVMGEAAQKIIQAWSGKIVTRPAHNMRQAVERAYESAQPGDIVLLSPACASFDMYKNFEERGQDFKLQVERLILEKTREQAG